MICPGIAHLQITTKMVSRTGGQLEYSGRATAWRQLSAPRLYIGRTASQSGRGNSKFRYSYTTSHKYQNPKPLFQKAFNPTLTAEYG